MQIVFASFFLIFTREKQRKRKTSQSVERTLKKQMKLVQEDLHTNGNILALFVTLYDEQQICVSALSLLFDIIAFLFIDVYSELHNSASINKEFYPVSIYPYSLITILFFQQN
jgi:hypothetical protein